MIKRLAVYIRLSDMDNEVRKGLVDVSDSIENQRLLLYDYIKNHNEFSDYECIEYYDDGVSGTLFKKRNNFKAMIADAEKGTISCIIAKDLSRFGRDHIEVGYYTEMVFPMWNIRFIAVNDNFDSANFKGTTGGMEFSVKNLFNQLYSYDISKKVKSSLEMCRQAGKYVASQTPYGYMRDPADKHKLIIDERYAPAIRIIFEMAAKGKNGVKIAKYLNENGYSSSRRETVYNWTSSLVMRKLRVPTYMGDLAQGRYENIGLGDYKRQSQKSVTEWNVVENAVPAIVSKELFEKANANFPVKHTAKREIKNVNLFHCAYCGCKMKVQFRGLKMVCPKRKTSLNYDCQSVYILSETAHNAVLSAVKEACLLMLDRFELIQSQAETQIKSVKKAVTSLKTEKAKLEKAPFTLYKDYKAGKITKEEFTVKKELAAEQLADIEKEIAAQTELLTITEKPAVDKQDLLNCSQLAKYDGNTFSNIIERINVYAPDKIEIIFKCDDFYQSCLKSLQTE